MSVIEELTKIFEENKEKRICVLGTTCTGKTTLIKQLNMGVDMDKEIFPLLTKEETDYVCQTPWTKEIGKKMDTLVRKNLSVEPGVPMFGTVLLDCDLIVYLHIDDELLEERAKDRKVDFDDAKNMQLKIEDEIDKSVIETVKVKVDKKMVLKR